MLYLDTALVVTAVTAENATVQVQHWLGEQEDDALAVSNWVTTEVSAALSLKIRTGDLSLELRDEADAAYRTLLQEMTLLHVTASDFERGAELARFHESGLRGGDALHLAVASANGATLCTLDKRFAQACDRLGLPFELIG